MKILKLFGFFFLFVVLAGILVLGYFGFIPGLSALMGSDKPRDLGTRWTEADRVSGREKSKVVYEAAPAGTSIENAIITSGKRDVNTSWSSSEMTAIFNNKPFGFWPFKNVQLKFNSDGSGEISGTLVKSKIPSYASYLGVPGKVTEVAMKFLPNDPAFYVKGVASLENNKVALFEPQNFEIGRMPLPVSMFLSFVPPSLVSKAYALDTKELSSELSKVENKRAIIISFINQRLTRYSGFFAKSAKFSENKLIFEGTLPEKEVSIH